VGRVGLHRKIPTAQETVTILSMAVLYDGAGSHGWITVTEENGIRYLQLDGTEEGAMDVHSENPVFHYLWFHKCSFLAQGPVGRALVLGAGAFTAPKLLAVDHPGAVVDAVDIEDQLERIARRYFRLELPAFARIRFHGIPGEQFLAEQPQQYDFIVDDLFDGFQHVPCRGRDANHVHRLRLNLADGGVCVKNLIWNPLIADTRAGCDETWQAWQSEFPNYLSLVLGDPDIGHNRLLIGANYAGTLAFTDAKLQLAHAGVPDHILHHTHDFSGRGA